MNKKQKFIASVCALVTTLSLTACTSKGKGVVNVNTIAFTGFSKDISTDEINNTKNT